MRNWEDYVRGKLSLPNLPPERESRIVRELGAQLEDFYREALARGESEAEAEEQAARQIVDWDRMAQDLWLADRSRAANPASRWSRKLEDRARVARMGGNMLADLVADARFAIRGLAKNPGFALVAVLTLALGIGATTAIFRVIDGVLLRPLPYDALLDRLRSLPQVRSAGMVQSLPIEDDYFLSFTVEGRPAPSPGEEPSANYRVVSHGYFETLGIPIARGRSFDARDGERPPLAAIVDEAFVRRHFPGEDPLGRGIDVGNGRDGFYEIVGVAGDVHHAGLDLAHHPTIYLPYPQDAFSTMSIVLRADSDPLPLAADVRDLLREVDGSLPAYSVRALEDVVSESLGARRFSTLLLALFAGTASFLAAVGLYGVVSYTVSLRTREMGMRLAVGASKSSLILTMMAQGMKPALAGIGIGLAAALLLARLLETLLFGVTPFDPASYAATALLLFLVAAIACFVPARRASGLDPLAALRHQ